MPTFVPSISKSNASPPFVGFEPLKRQKVDIESACRPPVCLLAGSGAGTINGDVTTPCVNDKVNAFDGLQEYKVEYRNLTCHNEFSVCNNYAEAMYEVKNHRNNLSDLKSQAFTPNGDVSNGPKVVFTFVSEGGVTVTVYDACVNGTCSCSHVIGGEPAQLKPCRFLYLYSLATAEGKNHFSPLMSSIVDG